MTDTEDSLVRRLRQFQADEPGFPPLFSHAAAEIERLKREIVRCDDACFKRDKEIAELKGRVAGLWACTGCGSMKSIEQIRKEHPGAIACCPEREMAPLSPSHGETP